ncbi:MAG: phage tail protein, partial [Gammaproteobacteria bacterium]|nr:phage tail protein [Gammaproteobacteria bacterium]
VVDFRTTAEELLFDIAAAGRARKVMPDGRYSVVIDDLKPAIAQHFTPRNSWGFSVEVSFKDELPHALRIPFMNEQAGYLEDQRLVYRDGFDVFNATKVEKLELRGITDPALIWKHGRYHFAQAELRPDGYSFFADIEHLLCNVGDRVELSQDVISAGLGRGRIKAVLDDGASPPNAVAIELDDQVEMAAGTSYGVRVRKADGTSLVKTIETVAGVQTVLTFSAPFPLAEAPEPDDLFLFGEAGRESVGLLIVGIERAQDLSAKIRCVDYAPEVQEADAGPAPPFQSSVVSPALLPKPEIIGVRSDDTAMYQGPDGSWTGRIVATVEIPSDLDPLVIGIEGQYRLQGASGSWSRTAIQNLADNEVVLEPVEDKQTYELRLRYVRNTLRAGPWSDLVV